MENGGPSWTTCGKELQPVWCAENWALVLPRMPCMEPLWVKVRERELLFLGAKAFTQLRRDFLENSTFYLDVLSLQFGCLNVFIMRHGIPQKTGRHFKCFAYHLPILDAAPVCTD